jgi:hypothetical protein
MVRLRFKTLLMFLTALMAAFVLVLGWIVAQRVAYPYDYFIWSESPFLTNMLKLHNDVALYGPVSDANSFVYAPGLEYLCFTLLEPFDLHLDVRACRAVNVAVGVVAAVLAGLVQTKICEATSDEPPPRRLLLPFTIATSAMIIFRNFTSDVCHPDNLHMLHLMVGMALGYRALTRKDHRLAIATAALLGFGVVLKQTAALGGIGVAGFLAFYGRRQWGKATSAAVVAAAVTTTALSCWWLLIHHEHGAFWLYGLLRQHAVELSKLEHLFGHDVLMPHRVVLYVGALLCGLRALASEREELRVYAGLWLTAGFFGVFPAFAAYIKHFGLWNNLVVVDAWAALLVIPMLIRVASQRGLSHDRGLLAAAALLVISIGAYPNKRGPDEDHYRYGQQIEGRLRADLAAGHAVLVCHGTAALIRAGYRDVPRDRTNTMLELIAAGRRTPKETLDRIETHYQRIYDSWPPLPGDAKQAVRRNFVREGTIYAVSQKDQNIGRGVSPNVSATIHIMSR